MSTAFEQSILQFIECALTVVPRPDLDAVEVRIRDAEQVTAVLLAPQQVMAVAALLIAAAAEVEP
jgi:hypothetical protein